MYRQEQVKKTKKTSLNPVTEIKDRVRSSAAVTLALFDGCQPYPNQAAFVHRTFSVKITLLLTPSMSSVGYDLLFRVCPRERGTSKASKVDSYRSHISSQNHNKLRRIGGKEEAGAWTFQLISGVGSRRLSKTLDRWTLLSLLRVQVNVFCVYFSSVPPSCYILQANVTTKRTYLKI